ncbi:glycosyltransferase family 4 protein [Citrobacter sp. RHB21-C05]|uniref:glycosyltransferase family 4 protein n=2 Tax=Enterobacteriaceae TaxID=543 RepID=UPI0015EB0609|nr:MULTISPECIES: glycosyltransferase family 4 protein [Citrobacter]QMK45631.1 glycosyltransferase family 4 protein [Citrobacter sp. RHB21-C05]QMK64075.1 glycosyltransferase family 4 protein [Citrobacter sp. RHB21-C01]HCJ6320650.1 glycosyltransferase family 4 protein [Citrobacter sedlakii]
MSKIYHHGGEMRIAMILPSLEKSGPGIHVEALSRALVAIGCYVEVFYLRSCEKKCLLFNFTKCTKFSFSIKNIRYLSGFDIIHTHGFFPDLYGVILTKIFVNSIHVSTMHNFLEQDLSSRYNGWKRTFYIFLWTNVIKKISHKVVFTELAKDYYQRLVGGHINVVGSGIDVFSVLEELSTRSYLNSSVVDVLHEVKKNKKIIGSTSIITEIKSLDLIVRALPDLPDYAAVFVGGGPLENDLIIMAEKLGVAERCIFIGFTGNPLPYLSFFDVYAMPSKSESFGLSLFEAIAAKLPIVCRDLPVFQELLPDVGLHKFDGTLLSFVDTIRNINGKKSTELAFEKLLDKYDMKNVACRYVKFYQEIAEQ